jgi:L-fuconolactonase
MRMFDLTRHLGELPPSSEDLAAAWRSYIETCIAAFGPERAMFEGNFPVDKGSCGYAALRNAFKRIDPRRCTKAVILNGYACSADR